MAGNDQVNLYFKMSKKCINIITNRDFNGADNLVIISIRRHGNVGSRIRTIDFRFVVADSAIIAAVQQDVVSGIKHSIFESRGTNNVSSGVFFFQPE